MGNPSNENCVRLREVLEMRIINLETRFEDYKTSQESALVLAKQEADRANVQLAKELVNYKANTNEWQKTFRDFRDSTSEDILPRGETLAIFKEHRGLIDKLTESIVEIQKSISRGEGGTGATTAARLQSNWFIGIVVSAGLFLAAQLILLLYFLANKH